MKSVILARRFPEFAKEIEQMDLATGKVYRTTVYSTDDYPSSELPGPVAFVTTSKDLHLELGRMSEKLQWELVKLVVGEIGGDGGTLLLTEREDSPFAVLATMVTGNNIVIHLSKATN